MVRPLRKRPRGVTKYGRGASGYGTYVNVPTAVPFRPGLDRRNVGNLHVAQGEKKFLDTAVDLAIGATAGLIEDSIVHVAQGTAEDERIGRNITVTNIHINALPFLNAHATVASDIGRYILYIDHQCNGATAAVTDILEAATVLRHRNLANNTRFTILLDKKTVLTSTVRDTVNNLDEEAYGFFDFHWYDPKGIKIEYNAVLGAIAEIRQNNIGVLWINEKGNMSVKSMVRIRYTDT